MKNTNPIFNLKNFRSFGEDGADFELAPITVLTGCNSAGKSSLVKALMLIAKQNKGNCLYNEIKRTLPDVKLSVSSQELALGRFDNVINSDAENGTLELSYKIWSQYLQECVIVKRLFRAKKNDPLNNGELSCYSIEKLDGTVIHKNYSFYDKPSGETHFESIKENYEAFIAACKGLDLSRMEESEKNPKEIEENKYRDKYDKSLLIGFRDIIQQKKGGGYSLFGDDEMWVMPYRGEETDDEKKEKMKELFIDLMNNKLVYPSFLRDIEYIDSSSASIKRLYSIEDNNKMCNSLRALNRRSLSDADALNEGIISINYAQSFLNKWIKKFDIGDSIKVEGTDQGLGIMVFLVKNGEKRLLADEGYGITQLVSLLLCIDNTIPGEPDDDYRQTYKPRYICVEEPEIHLHPKYQSLLADMFVEAYQKYNIHFIIETHSEYLIRKLQVLVADKDNILSSNDVSLNYVEKDKSGVSSNRKIEILEDGRLSEPFGPGFFDESKSLVMKMLKF